MQILKQKYNPIQRRLTIKYSKCSQTKGGNNTLTNNKIKIIIIYKIAIIIIVIIIHVSKINF